MKTKADWSYTTEKAPTSLQTKFIYITTRLTGSLTTSNILLRSISGPWFSMNSAKSKR